MKSMLVLSASFFVLLFAFVVGEPGKTLNARVLDLSDQKIKKSLVRVRIFPVLQNHILPWVKMPGKPGSITGVVVAKNRILIRAEDVRSARLIQLQKYSSYQLVEAKVDHLDMESNLALLSVSAPNFFKDLKAIPIGSNLAVGEEAMAVKVDALFRVHREKVRILDTRIVADFGLTHLPVQNFRSDEYFGTGNIVVSKGKLRGMIAYAGKKKELVPGSVINAYRKRTLSSQAAFVSVGFQYTDIIDVSRREYYGLPNHLSGALLTKIIPGTSAFSNLKKNDIILKIENINIDNAGFFESDKNGKRPVSMLFVLDKSRLRKPGERISIEIFRNKKIIKTKIRLISYSGNAERIPWMVPKKTSYLVESGIVFVELSVPLLRQAFGKNWASKAVELGKIYKEKQYYEDDKRDRIVVISRVLPDESNRGYKRMSMIRVLESGGQKITGIESLKTIFAKATKSKSGFADITLSGGRKVFLDMRARDEINSRISRKYRIPKSN